MQLDSDVTWQDLERIVPPVETLLGDLKHRCRMQRLPFQPLTNSQDSRWVGQGMTKPQSFPDHADRDAAHFIASQRMAKVPTHGGKDFEIASPQSMAPTPQRFCTAAADSLDCNVLYGSLEDEAGSSPDPWAGGRKPPPARRLAQRHPLADTAENDENMSASAFNFFSPADWKRSAIEKTEAGTLSSTSILEPLQDKAALQEQKLQQQHEPERTSLADLRLPVQTAHASSKLLAGAHTSAHSPAVNPVTKDSINEGSKLVTAQPEVEANRTQLSRPALAEDNHPAPANWLQQERQHCAGAACQAESAYKGNDIKGGPQQEAAAKQKPKPPLRTGLEAPSYPCYTEILRRVRLRPEVPAGQQRQLAKKNVSRPAKTPSGQPLKAKRQKASECSAAEGGANAAMSLSHNLYMCYIILAIHCPVQYYLLCQKLARSNVL